MSLKIIFAGTPEFSLPALEALLNSEHAVIGVLTQPDRAAGRGRHLHESPVKQLAIQHQIPIYQPISLKKPEQQAHLAQLKPDLIVVVAYGLLLPKTVLAIPTFGCINIHASLLPRFRGASPIQQALLAGDKETGISIMQMDEGLDTGDVLSLHTCAIDPGETSSTLQDKLSLLGAKALIDILKDIGSKNLSPQKQNNQAASHAPKISKQDAMLNWEESAVVLERKIRAFNPWPVATTTIDNQIVRIWAAKVLEPSAIDSTIQPGTIVHSSKEGIDMATGEGILRITELQLPGGKRLPVKEILNAKGKQWGQVLIHAYKF